jgi:hypothetical protein
MIITAVSLIAQTMVLAGEPDGSLKEAADGLRTNAEDMVAHGGMGDAKAIVHHCGEAARYAETLIKQVPTSNHQRDEAMASLNDVIKQCKRVAEIGIHADPGVLLNPAIKARTAARTSVKALGLAK